MAGVPYHSAQQYIECLDRKRLQGGYSRADGRSQASRRCGQTGSGPSHYSGTVVDSTKPDSANNFLVALSHDETDYGLAYMDLVTGEFQVTSLNDFAMVCGEIRNLRAREIVLTYSLSEMEERVLLGQ